MAARAATTLARRTAAAASAFQAAGDYATFYSNAPLVRRFVTMVPIKTRPRSLLSDSRRRVHGEAGLEARVQGLEVTAGKLEINADKLQLIATDLQGKVLAITDQLEGNSNKLFRLEVVTTDLQGKVLSITHTQEHHTRALAALTELAVVEARRSNDRFAEFKHYATETVVRMGTVSYRIFMMGCAAAATVGFGVLQIVDNNSGQTQEKKAIEIYEARAAGLEEKLLAKVEETVAKALKGFLLKDDDDEEETGPPLPR